ncbi:MAG: hypothetical protein BGP11_05530 [Rhodobacterales bacterium 65-51]|uniref:hypothetical protein n=1 Tax=uncultured Gemmobacter sp. TaxID=1095917 RepID=UPI00095E6ED9|nr:hypothetical protein [uncultured Gemmobacter sp.]OJY33184.1 MAG: hypothetical protein BGP11_05530 [Rhodobacterales bacterium 65-51]
MRHSVVSTLIAATLLAACSTQLGGDGQLSNGEPLSVLMQVDMNAVDAVTTLDIVSLDGWSCKTVIRSADQPAQVGVRQSFPMKCSDGATGTILMTQDNIQKRMHGAFKLSNGRSGRVTFDFKPSR